MSRLLTLLSSEPTAIGSLVASVAPLLVLSGAVRIDADAIAALVIAVNALVGFGVRLAVTPAHKAPAGAPAGAPVAG